MQKFFQMTQNTNSIIWLVSQSILAVAITSVLFLTVSCYPRNGSHELHVLATGDVHGAWFDTPYISGGSARPSLMSLKPVLDSIRRVYGPANVLLVDAGDCLQGDNAAYYYNYVETSRPHLFPRLMSYLGYDAVVVGNHDIETGHEVYDRVTGQLASFRIPFLAGNAISDSNGTPYWPEFRLVRRSGMRVLILGYTNPNISSWLKQSLWEGMHFESLLPLVQERVDVLRKKYRPDVVVAAVHSGAGPGDGTVLESQGMDLFKSLKGVDVLICGHDHSPRVESAPHMVLVNAGSKAGKLAHAVVKAEVRRGKICSKSFDASLVDNDPSRADATMKEAFAEDFEAVRAFTVKEIGYSECALSASEAFGGRCAMTDLVHTVQLKTTGAQVSFAAPLSQRTMVPAGKLTVNDLFAIYPFENTLYSLEMTGAQIRSYLEYSYSKWVCNPFSEGHALQIRSRGGKTDGSLRWSFVHPAFNFDSAAGIFYTVDLSKEEGQRVCITGMAGGLPFDENATYSVAMNSYRASGAGDMLGKGAGINTDELQITGRYPEIRELISRYITDCGTLTPQNISDPELLGNWSFIPEKQVRPFIERDLALLFAPKAF